MDLSNLDAPEPETPLEDSLMNEAAVDSLGPKTAVMVTPETTVREAIEKMIANNIGCVLVGKNDEVVGIFSERDLLLAIADRLEEVQDEAIEEFMTRNPETLESSVPVVFALNRMCLGDFRHLPLTEKGRLKGIISLRDFLTLLFRTYPDLSPETP